MLLLGAIMFHELNPCQVSNFENPYLINAGNILCCNGNHQTFMICWAALCFPSLGHCLWKELFTERYMHIKDKIFISFHITGFCAPTPFDVSRTSAIWIGANINISYFMVAFFFLEWWHLIFFCKTLHWHMLWCTLIPLLIDKYHRTLYFALYFLCIVPRNLKIEDFFNE